MPRSTRLCPLLIVLAFYLLCGLAAAPLPRSLALHDGTPTPAAPPEPAPAAANADWTPVVRSVGGIDMVLVPPGCFPMGSTSGENAEPVHEQCFERAFWIDRTEVTSADYRAFIDAGGYERPEYWTPEGWAWLGTLRERGPRVYYDDVFGEPDHPQVGVSWYEAAAYARWRGGRLPTEAEWEYAARGPDGLRFPWGNTFDGARLNACDHSCSFDVTYEDGYSETAPVGSFPGGASWVGALDMVGNAFEWTGTVFDPARFPYPYRPDDGREALSDSMSVRRVTRGGSWMFGGDFNHAVLRFGFHVDFRDLDLGFRIVVPVAGG